MEKVDRTPTNRREWEEPVLVWYLAEVVVFSWVRTILEPRNQHDRQIQSDLMVLTCPSKDLMSVNHLVEVLEVEVEEASQVPIVR